MLIEKVKILENTKMIQGWTEHRIYLCVLVVMGQLFSVPLHPCSSYILQLKIRSSQSRNTIESPCRDKTRDPLITSEESKQKIVPPTAAFKVKQSLTWTINMTSAQEEALRHERTKEQREKNYSSEREVHLGCMHAFCVPKHKYGQGQL